MARVLPPGCFDFQAFKRQPGLCVEHEHSHKFLIKRAVRPEISFELNSGVKLSTEYDAE